MDLVRYALEKKMNGGGSGSGGSGNSGSGSSVSVNTLPVVNYLLDNGTPKIAESYEDLLAAFDGTPAPGTAAYCMVNIMGSYASGTLTFYNISDSVSAIALLAAPVMQHAQETVDGVYVTMFQLSAVVKSNGDYNDSESDTFYVVMDKGSLPTGGD